MTHSNVQSSIPVAVVGPTGYTGLELIEWLLGHPSMHIAYLASARADSSAFSIDDEFPRLKGRLPADVAACRPIDADAIASTVRLAFLCLPHEASMQHGAALVAAGCKVVDLSAAYRIKDVDLYEFVYGHAHTDRAGVADAVYGLTEHAREDVRRATLVANPGCYPTAALNALIPLVRDGLIDPETIVINAASGVSGAGRSPKPHLHYPEANENFSAYGVGVHRHQPEIAESLTRLTGWAGARPPLFVPHLLPVARGIHETIYAEPATPDVTTETLHQSLQECYDEEPFIVVRDDAPAGPTIRDVAHTNAVHISAQVTNGRVVVIATEDNLVKGAAGQAIQNANVMLDLPETAGLHAV